MAAEDGETPVRRSSRKRKEISYKDVEGVTSPNSATPETVEVEVEELDAAFVDEPVPEPKPKKKARAAEYGDVDPASKKLGIGAKGWDDRIYALAGTDQDTATAMGERVDKWKDVLGKIPEELLDYTIGWGIATGSWGAGGGERQNVEFIDSRLFFEHDGADYSEGEKTFKIDSQLKLSM